MNQPATSRPPLSTAARRWWMALFFFFVVGLALWLVTFAYHHASKRSFEDYAAELAAKGESLEVADLRPAPVKPEENVATAPVFATFLDRCRANPKADADDDPVWGGLDISSVPGYSTDHLRREENQVRHLTYSPLSQGFDPPDESAAAKAILAYGDLNAPTLDEIRDALGRPSADFQVVYGDNAAVYSELGVFFKACDLLRLQGRAALLLGRNDLARSNAMALLRFSRHFGSHATLIHRVFGDMMNRFAISLIHEGLATGKWADGDLNAFAGELESRWMESAFLRAIRMDRAVALSTLEQFSREPGAWAGDDAYWIRPVLHIPDLRKGWVYDSGEFYCRVLQETILEDGDGERLTTIISTPFRPLPEISPAGSGLRDQFRFHVKFFRHGLGDLMFSAYTGSRISTLRAQVLRDHARIATAIALHRSEHGAFPPTLNSLALSDRTPLPLDPFSGAPFVYRPLGTTDYLLYSVGPDGEDDGGLIRYPLEVGDWVWLLHLPEDFDYEAYRGR